MSFVTTQIVIAQDIIKKGTLELVEQTVSPKLNGNEVIPPLEDNEGIIKLSVSDNNYFDADDVADWLKNGRITLLQIDFDRNSIRVQRDESILIRFKFNFLTGQEHVARKVQIKVDAFNTYFRSHRFYKQQVAEYELQVSEPPTYDQPLEITGSLTVDTNIEGAEVIVIDNEGVEAGSRFVIDKSATFEVPIGTYRIIVRKPGYTEQQLTEVQVSKDQETLHNVELEAVSTGTSGGNENSTVTFNTNVDRVSIAIIAEDGTQRGLTAFDKIAKTQLPPGRYNIIANLNGFREISETIEVPRDSTIVQDLRMISEGNLESLTIQSQPSGAQITINGENYGTTPRTIQDLERKPYEIVLEKQNYKTYSESVDFAIQNSYTLDHKLRDSFIRISTRPSGAKVIINGEEKGVTPYSWSNPEWKEYDIRIEKELYEPIETTVDLAQVGGYNLNETLNKKVSTVTLASAGSPVPLDIQVTGQGINKTYSRSAITNLDLPYGNYHVMIERPGFKPIEKDLFIDEQDFEFNYEIDHKKKGVAVMLSTFFPGVGQYYWGHGGRGTLVLLVEAAAIGGSVYFLNEFTSKRDDYLQAKDAYKSAVDQSTFDQRYAAMNNAYDEMTETREMFLIAASVAAGTWALNIVDRLLIPSPTRIIRKSNKQADLGQNESVADLNLRATGNGLALRINF